MALRSGIACLVAQSAHVERTEPVAKLRELARSTEVPLQLQPKSLIGRAREVLPEGTIPVGLGLFIASASAYGVVIIINAVVGDKGYAGFGVFWSLIFVVGPGIFLPLEQEVSRAIAHRSTEGVGSAPLVVRAATVGGIAAVVILVVASGFSSVMIDHLFHGSNMLLIAFLISLFGFYVMHLTRGVLSGNGRFVPYGVMVGADGIIRLVLVAVLAIGGVSTVGPFGLAMAVTPFLASLAVLMDRRGLLSAGPHADWSELSAALGMLLTISILSQVLAYLALMISGVTASFDVARSFTNAFFVARIPVLMFMAVQAALLPKLARLAASDEHLDFREALRRLLISVVGVAILGTLLAFALGPFVGSKIFPDKFDIARTDLSVLAAGSGVFIIGQTITQALIALKAYGLGVAGWAFGCAVYLVVTLVLDVHVTLEVSIAFCAGAGSATAVLAILLAQRMKGVVPDSPAGIFEAIEHEAVDI